MPDTEERWERELVLQSFIFWQIHSYPSSFQPCTVILMLFCELGSYKLDMDKFRLKIRRKTVTFRFVRICNDLLIARRTAMGRKEGVENTQLAFRWCLISFWKRCSDTVAWDIWESPLQSCALWYILPYPICKKKHTFGNWTPLNHPH